MLLDPPKDLPLETIENWIQKALNLCKTGFIKV